MFKVSLTDTIEQKIWFLSRVFIIARKPRAKVLHHFLQRHQIDFLVEMERKAAALKGMWQPRPSQGAVWVISVQWSCPLLPWLAPEVAENGTRKIFPCSVPFIYLWVARGEVEEL